MVFGGSINLSVVVLVGSKLIEILVIYLFWLWRKKILLINVVMGLWCVCLIVLIMVLKCGLIIWYIIVLFVEVEEGGWFCGELILVFILFVFKLCICYFRVFEFRCCGSEIVFVIFWFVFLSGIMLGICSGLLSGLENWKEVLFKKGWLGWVIIMFIFFLVVGI